MHLSVPGAFSPSRLAAAPLARTGAHCSMPIGAVAGALHAARGLFLTRPGRLISP